VLAGHPHTPLWSLKATCHAFPSLPFPSLLFIVGCRSQKKSGLQNDKRDTKRSSPRGHFIV